MSNKRYFSFFALTSYTFFSLISTCMYAVRVKVNYEDPLENIFGKIQYAALLVRHGDRYPLATYPTDPYKNHQWPGGAANLNEIGKSKQYRLGKWFRDRYNHLVTGKWEEDKKNFKMHSSDAKKTYLSGIYLQYGFYRRNETDLPKFEAEKWEPIQVLVIPKEEDNVLGLRRQQQCKYFQKRKKHLYRIPTVKEKLVGQDGIVAYIAKNAGYDFSNTSLDEQYDILANVHDIITSQIENGVKLPDWANKIFPQPFDQVALSRIHIKNRDPVCLRFTAGPFLHLLITEMRKHMEHCGPRQPVLHFFMAHDYVSMVVLSALGATNDDLIPPYASAIIFELRKKDDLDIVTVGRKMFTVFIGPTGGSVHLKFFPQECPMKVSSKNSYGGVFPPFPLPRRSTPAMDQIDGDVHNVNESNYRIWGETSFCMYSFNGRNIPDPMSYKNTTSGPPTLLEVPACGPPCLFETFFKVTENCHIFPDWNAACNEPYRVYR